VEIIGRISKLTKLAFDSIALDVTSDGNVYAIRVNDDPVQHVQVLNTSDGRLDLLIDGRRHAAYVSSEGQSCWVTLRGRTYKLTRSLAASRASAAHEGSSELAAPMPGQVRAVSVTAGDPVTKGQTLLILEAMKMEIRLQASYDGIILSVDAKVGQTVERDQVLVRLNRV
jgi:acetyl/propionyl-CoA carboxylase alpha subunit